MKRKRSEVLVYADDKRKLYTTLGVKVDETGEEWLSADQVDFLENAYFAARHTWDNALNVSEELICSGSTASVAVGKRWSSRPTSAFFNSSPVIGGIVI